MDVDKNRLTLEALVAVSAARSQRFYREGVTEKFTLADWGNALAGESGEACNIIKKMRRIQLNMNGNVGEDLEWDLLRDKLGMELADTLMYVLLTAEAVGVDIVLYACQVFNTKSRQLGFPERISHVAPYYEFGPHQRAPFVEDALNRMTAVPGREEDVGDIGYRGPEDE